MNLNNFKVIIVAGGSGKRMGKDIPKQFLTIHQKPIIIHTLQRFLQVFEPHNMIICIKENHKPKLEALLQEYNLQGITFVNGGEHRTDSVRNGLKAIHQLEPNFMGYVLIHDAVRPFVSVDFLKQFLSELTKKNPLIAVCPVKNSLRKITENGTEAVNREHYLEVQTPQGFLFPEIYEAYQNTSQLFSDDASLYENYFHKPIYTIQYIPENIKITTIVDLILADYLVKNGY